MIDRGRYNVLGVMIDAVDYEGAVERIARAAKDRRAYAVSALAVHGVMTGALERTHRHRLNRFDLIVPDGQPVRWALNRLHRTKLTQRVYGPNLMLETCRRATQDGLPIFLFGGTDELLGALTDALLEKFPGLMIAGTLASRFQQVTEADMDALAATIKASGAALTFVGLGCPRQEVWTFEMQRRLPMPMLAVGAAFAFHAGLLPQAPAWMQDRGLEWLYRLAQEPRRLWRRYLLLNPLYVSLVALQYLHIHQFDMAEDDAPREPVCYG